MYWIALSEVCTSGSRCSHCYAPYFPVVTQCDFNLNKSGRVVSQNEHAASFCEASLEFLDLSRLEKVMKPNCSDSFAQVWLNKNKIQAIWSPFIS